MPVMLSTAEDMCPHGTACQVSPNTDTDTTPNANSDLDSDDGPNINSAWAGIAVVIVVLAVGVGVWYGLRRRRRTRGGHNSVDPGEKKFRASFARRFGAFWRKPFAAKSSQHPITVGGDMELVEDEEAKPRRRSSSASNLKRTTTSGTVETDATHATKLDKQLETVDPEAKLYPSEQTRLPSAQVTTPAPIEPLPSHDAPQTTRPSTPSSIRSSLSRLSIPPPGLGPPLHASAQPPSPSVPPS